MKKRYESIEKSEKCPKCGAHIPYKKKDAYAKLDAMLSEEDKEALKTGDAIESSSRINDI